MNEYNLSAFDLLANGIHGALIAQDCLVCPLYQIDMSPNKIK